MDHKSSDNPDNLISKNSEIIQRCNQAIDGAYGLNYNRYFWAVIDLASLDFKKFQKCFLHIGKTLEMATEELRVCKAQLANNKESQNGVLQRDYNALNIQFNEAQNRIKSLEKENEDLKYMKRIPLSVLKTTPNKCHDVTKMFKSSVEIKKEEIKRSGGEMIGDDIGSIRSLPSSQQNDTSVKVDSSELSATQFTLNGDSESNNQHELDQPFEESFDPNKNVFVVDESIDLGAHKFDLPSSSPMRISNKSESNDIKVKKEIGLSVRSSQEFEDFEVRDSEFESADEIPMSYPTPKTSSKYQTPNHRLNAKSRSQKRQLGNISTPSDFTPLKKLKSSKKRLDLTNNPEAKRQWIIEDFKINPSKNQDLNFAYDEVFRGAQRKCIHGKSCKDCDMFYANAINGFKPEKFEGPAWDSKPGSTRDIISNTSRHRNVWDRDESPPGFGDFDFPTTQEQQLNKIESKQLNKKKAYERLISALNGGRFLFRNENYNRAVTSKQFVVDNEVIAKHCMLENPK